ncbi:MAG TPA: aromatic amino acid lyase [Kiloniellales bacterium]|nr:aromatic amino acid lyase [Kiloniellales bacterium]
MAVTLNSRADLTLDHYRRVAWGGEGVTLGKQAQDAMAAARKAFSELIEKDDKVFIYGVTSGYGHMASKRLNREERKAQAKRPRGGAASSFGEPMPERVVRGIVFARLTNFVEGHAAITPKLGNDVAAMLSNGPLPEVPGLGNGCPGEIQALGYLFHGVGTDDDYAEKDSLSLVNGSPCGTALLADGALAARRRVELATQVFALSWEAFNAPLLHLDPSLDDLWEDPFERDALQGLRGWLDGVNHAERRPYQAPVSWRILPRILGYAYRAVQQAEEGAAISLKAVSDNPVYIPPTPDHPLGRVFSTGGYHNGKAGPCLDNLAAAWADLALLADRHTDKMMNASVSLLPAGLKGRGDGYLGSLAFASAGFTEQARLAAQRTFLPGMESGGYGQNDVPVPYFHSWRHDVEAGRAFVNALALLAAISSQAFYVTQRQPPKKLAGFVEEIRTVFEPVDGPRMLGYDAEALAERFNERVHRA